MSADSEFSMRIVGQTGHVNPLAKSVDRHRQHDAASGKEREEHPPEERQGDEADAQADEEGLTLPAKADGDEDAEGRIDFLV